MNLKSLLANMDSPTKIASVGPTKTTPGHVEKTASSPALAAAINDAMADLGQVKTAAPTEPRASDAARLASQVLGLDKEADLQHSHQMGRAMASGFVAQLDLVKQASANVLGEKIAAEGVTEEELALVKMARENPQAFLAEVQRGIADGTQDAEKTASETYTETYNALIRGVHKTASDHFVEGYARADVVLQKLAAQTS